MLNASRHLIIYKDSPDARNLYFGPFVSDRLAYDFMDALPTPRQGGNKVVKLLSPYTSDDAHLAVVAIMSQRSNGDLYENIRDIIAA